ncbi:hypothetical protein T01_4038 [Trichinella spiralis]|uniref:Uncharacterized protein n=1 Tax=Trichinella spiralis TaxID=6334 RepID=A0A0V1BGG7_TRISP|nr:hypothetical protein T01_4038 [Trichinella spiralis]
MHSHVKLELHDYTMSIAKNKDVRLTGNFQQIEALQLIRVESSWPVALFPSRGGTVDSQQLVVRKPPAGSLCEVVYKFASSYWPP